jgi:endonuclease YncB( thermonuclease family)
MRLKKIIFLIILILLQGLALSLTSFAYNRVVSVYDGDTVLLKNGAKIRYLGINTPEIDHEGNKSEFMAHTAKDFNQKLANGALVRLEFDLEKKDRYKRVLAYVFLQNGDMVNALLVRKGLAYVISIRPNLKYRDLLLECQRKAIKESIGIWSNLLRDKGENCLGNRRSYRFHRPDCYFAMKISQKNLIKFRSIYDAFWEGYSPCKRCRPTVSH